MRRRNLQKTAFVAVVAAAFLMGGLAVSGVMADHDPNHDKKPKDPDAQPGDDGKITRTFNANVWAQVDFKNFGTGIYDPGPPLQPCPITILGFRAVTSDSTYYQSLRTGLNHNTGIVHVDGPGSVGPAFDCSVLGGGPNTNVWIEDVNIWGPYGASSVDQLLCGKAPAADCFPQADSSYMSVYRCNDPTFTFPAPTDPKGIFAFTPLQGVFSRSIDCGSISDAKVYYDNEAFCQTFFFDNGIWGTAFCLVKNEQHVPQGTGGDYMVSCMRTDYLFVNGFQGISELRAAKSHDYTLILDVGGPNPGFPLPHHFDGYHDLGGQNDCPAQPDQPVYDADAKKNAKTVITIP